MILNYNNCDLKIFAIIPERWYNICLQNENVLYINNNLFINIKNMFNRKLFEGVIKFY